MDAAHPPVVVHAPQPTGRRVTILGEDAGLATGPDDVREFLRRAGLEDAEPDDPGLVEWRGGGPGHWLPEG
ncbi:hypothetical protein [Streptomyces tsukubensis]|uniref:Uncharacterized protein n=1 Tax=Streptomyces tsukubensis TaxID=83656 RepID=A0A1V4AFR5_9ACTN|nr:hypothetical protein [Streptomyces tsukubensis]OON82527.1 hypothetical protein B1H18_00035 [Streptomyces tsukubensis]QFR92314.1 hypothetical protein GBW32_03655 [Streptomyces tsukubensis]